MPVCSIYSPGNHLARRFTTESSALGDSISVGTSPRCAVVIGGLDADAGVEGLHFSLVRRPDGWHIVSPGPRILLKNGRDAQNSMLSPGGEILFGNCRLAIAADPPPSDHRLLWQLPGRAEVMAGPLHRGANFIGSAEECEIRLDAPDIRPQHCAIRVEDWQVMAEPLESIGITLNGRPLAEPVAIHPGDVLAMAGIRACVVGRDAPARMPEQVSGYALTAWRMANLALFVVLAALVAYFFLEAIPDRSADGATPQPADVGTEQLAAALRDDVAAGQAEAALAKARAAHLADADPLVMALVHERDLAARLVRCRERLAAWHGAYQGPSFIRRLLSDPGMGRQLVPIADYWSREAKALAAGAKAVREGGHAELVAHSWALAHLAPVQEGIDGMVGLVLACQRLHDAWQGQRWDEAVAIFDQLAHAGEAGNDASRAFYQTALRRAEFGRDLISLGKDLDGCDFRTVDLAAIEARRQALEKSFPGMGFQAEESRPVLAQIDRDRILAAALNAVQLAYRAWRAAPDVDHLAALTLALRQARRDAGGMPVVAAMDVAVQQEIGDWLAPAAATLSEEPVADNLRQCRALMDICLTTSFARRDEVSRSLEAKERRILAAIQRECDQLMGEYQAGQGLLPDSLLSAFLDRVIATAPPGHRYHQWARREKARLAATPTPAP